jgi:hypothetical protein
MYPDTFLDLGQLYWTVVLLPLYCFCSRDVAVHHFSLTFTHHRLDQCLHLMVQNFSSECSVHFLAHCLKLPCLQLHVDREHSSV